MNYETTGRTRHGHIKYLVNLLFKLILFYVTVHKTRSVFLMVIYIELQQRLLGTKRYPVRAQNLASLKEICQIIYLSHTLVLFLYILLVFYDMILKFGAHLKKYFIFISLKFHCIHIKNTKITAYFCSHARFLYRVSLTLTLPIGETLPLAHWVLFSGCPFAFLWHSHGHQN